VQLQLPNRRLVKILQWWYFVGGRMIGRRTFLQLSSIIFDLESLGLALGAEDDVIPSLNNKADFANAWVNIDIGLGLAPFVAPPIKDEYIQLLSGSKIRHVQDIDQFFRKTAGLDFIKWLNSMPKLAYWDDQKIVGSDAQENLQSFWKSYIAARTPTMLEFLTYMPVFITEIGGDLKSSTERVNRLNNSTYPGIAYLFDTVELTSPTGRWRKKSYNGGLNRSCLQLFNDRLFIETFKSEAYADKLSGTKDALWNGDVYPARTFSTSDDPRITGIILECDFFKFRGRGLIQTTWRTNYLSVVTFVKNYRGNSNVITRFKDLWKTVPEEDILTASSNADWDNIFSEPSRDVLTYAVLCHARDGKYVPLSTLPDVVNGTSVGSVALFGDRLGGTGYGQRLKARVSTLCQALFH
jgi:hypothetical protein